MKTVRRASTVVVNEGNGPQPLSPNDWVETTEGEERDSIELSRNAKGEMSWSIKAYGDDQDAIREKVTTQNSVLEARYPRPKVEEKKP